MVIFAWQRFFGFWYYVGKGEIANKNRERNPFEIRRKAVEEYLSKEKFHGNFKIKSIHDKYGPTLDEDFDAIVVSPETKSTAEEINKIRKQRGRKPLKIIEIPFVLADDDLPISSTRIRNKEIDENGKLLKSN